MMLSLVEKWQSSVQAERIGRRNLFTEAQIELHKWHSKEPEL